VKRTDLIRHLVQNGCMLVREGGKHSVFQNPARKSVASEPRHREIKYPTALKIAGNYQCQIQGNADAASQPLFLC